VPFSNAAKTRNPLKFAGMSETPEPISAVIVTAEIRRGKKIEDRKKEETTGQKYNVRICYTGRP